MSERFIDSAVQESDLDFEVPLRPISLEDFAGQRAACERLDVLVSAAREREEPLAHCLFCGPPGLGKTTLANILARSMNTNIVVTSGPVIEKSGDLAGLLTNLQRGDILFIDEIHRLNRAIEELLYPAMEDFNLDLMIDSGPSARSVQVKLNRFTLIGATTRTGLLTSPLRSRFGLTCRLDYYEPETLAAIVQRSARLLEVNLNEEGALEIARRSRGTPRVANNLLRWVRDFAQTRSIAQVDRAAASAALEMLAIDGLGLDEVDSKLLRVLIEHYQGGPVGVGTLAVAIGEEKSTLEEVYEPFLIMKGLLKRTARGREATSLAYTHLQMEERC
jgi:holliday junction DNA helicase RuvB